MDDGDEAKEIRRRAEEFGRKATQVVQEGGSSHNNLLALIGDLKRLRDRKPLEQILLLCVFNYFETRPCTT
jgi:hypothetical protein